MSEISAGVLVQFVRAAEHSGLAMGRLRSRSSIRSALESPQSLVPWIAFTELCKGISAMLPDAAAEERFGEQIVADEQAWALLAGMLSSARQLHRFFHENWTPIAYPGIYGTINEAEDGSLRFTMTTRSGAPMPRLLALASKTVYRLAPSYLGERPSSITPFELIPGGFDITVTPASIPTARANLTGEARPLISDPETWRTPEVERLIQRLRALSVVPGVRTPVMALAAKRLGQALGRLTDLDDLGDALAWALSALGAEGFRLWIRRNAEQELEIFRTAGDRPDGTDVTTYALSNAEGDTIGKLDVWGAAAIHHLNAAIGWIALSLDSAIHASGMLADQRRRAAALRAGRRVASVEGSLSASPLAAWLISERGVDGATDLGVSLYDRFTPDFRDALLERAALHGLHTSVLEEAGMPTRFLVEYGDSRTSLRARVQMASERWALTKRETETLVGLLQGASNKELSTRMGISLRTAEQYVAALIRKAMAGTRAGVVASVWAMPEPFEYPHDPIGSATRGPRRST